jgi:hypothetical protein
VARFCPAKPDVPSATTNICRRSARKVLKGNLDDPLLPTCGTSCAIDKRATRDLTCGIPNAERLVQFQHSTCAQMKCGNLRIAWSVGCGVVCLLLFALWVRSYLLIDQIFGETSMCHFIAVTSGDGRLFLGWSDDPLVGQIVGGAQRRRIASNAPPVSFWPASISNSSPEHLFGWPQLTSQPFLPLPSRSRYVELIAPYWLLLISISAVGAACWLPMHFSLRTLSIVTTAVAMILYVAVTTLK